MPDNMGMNVGQDNDDKDYSFKVNCAGAIDIARIINENETAEAILVSAPRMHTQPMLLLSPSFLGVHPSHGPTVGNSILGPSWGMPFDSRAKGWHWKYIDNAKAIRQEIKAARAYKNAITVCVEIL